MFIIIRLNNRRYNPYQARLVDDLFGEYRQAKQIQRVSRQPLVSYYSDQRALEKFLLDYYLQAAFSRLVLLDMAVNSRYDMPVRQDDFQRHLNAADFLFGFHRTRLFARPSHVSTIPAPQPKPVQVATVTQSDKSVIDKAKKISQDYSDKLPDWCLDPISCEPLVDNPVLANDGRLYNKSTLENIQKSGDYISPFTKEPFTKLVAADFMYELIANYPEFEKGNKPAILAQYEAKELKGFETVEKIFPLNDALEELAKSQNTLVSGAKL